MKLMILFTLLVVAFVAGTSAQRRCPQAPPRATCVGARNVGNRCAANQPRTMWYYNAATRTCIAMPHNGCGGNSNRWCSLAYCQRACVRRTG